jgi:hypothetical protein
VTQRVKPCSHGWGLSSTNANRRFCNAIFRNCDSSQGKRLISCDQPTKEKKYTVLFQELNPSPYGLEFLPGETYYYICKLNFKINFEERSPIFIVAA